jgi:hypothetical protein
MAALDLDVIHGIALAAAKAVINIPDGDAQIEPADDSAISAFVLAMDPATALEMLRKIERLRKVAEAAMAVITRHDFDAQIPGTPIYALRDALREAGLIEPVGQLSGKKPLILYFDNDEDRDGFAEVVKGAFRNPVEMDVP